MNAKQAARSDSDIFFHHRERASPINNATRRPAVRRASHAMPGAVAYPTAISRSPSGWSSRYRSIREDADMRYNSGVVQSGCNEGLLLEVMAGQCGRSRAFWVGSAWAAAL